jgi:hypothetical protein
MVDRIQVIPFEDLHLECLPPKTRRALRFFSEANIVRAQWYLAGGTALALQAGHRQSVDLDFFTQQGSFKEAHLERALLVTKKWRTTLRESGTLYGEFDGAKMSFIAYPFFLPSRFRLNVGSVHMLTKEDIAVMKIIAISQRGRKRDFVDLYWYCKNVEPLISLLKRAPKQYPGQEANLPHFLKSLVYFSDADEDPMPRMFTPVSWRTVKQFFVKEVRSAVHELLF